jgi:hypothetical protein
VEKIAKLLSTEETAKVLVATISILNAAASTTDLLRKALLKFRERKVRFVVGDAVSMDAECDRAFEEVCEILRIMNENIPQRIAEALLNGECASAQNAPTTETLQ